MNKATRKAHELAHQLRVLEAEQLEQITGGGETASTSTSGTPAAGDDTVGDQTGSVGMPMTTFSLNYSKIQYD